MSHYSFRFSKTRQNSPLPFFNFIDFLLTKLAAHATFSVIFKHHEMVSIILVEAKNQYVHSTFTSNLILIFFLKHVYIPWSCFANNSITVFSNLTNFNWFKKRWPQQGAHVQRLLVTCKCTVPCASDLIIMRRTL